MTPIFLVKNSFSSDLYFSSTVCSSFFSEFFFFSSSSNSISVGSFFPPLLGVAFSITSSIYDGYVSDDSEDSEDLLS